jgi:hypothetical protein
MNPPRRALAVASAVAVTLLAAGGLGLYLRAAGPDPAEGNERAALDALGAVHTLQRLWRDGDADGDGRPDPWTADWSGFHRALARNGRPVAMMKPALAAADARPLAPGGRVSDTLPRAPHLGYWYAALPAPSPGGYAFVAWPDSPGAGGRRVYVTREDGAVWARDAGTGVPERFPADPAAEGWAKARAEEGR